MFNYIKKKLLAKLLARDSYHTIVNVDCGVLIKEFYKFYLY